MKVQSHMPILPEDVPLEFRVLLSACRVFLETEEPSRLEEHLEQSPDWNRLLALASRHGVMPLLYRSISQSCPKAVPQEWLMQLRMLYMQNAGKNIKTTHELHQLLDLFEANGILAIPFKGPALAQQVFGEVSLRTFSDLDIIVHKKDVPKAKEVLLSEGYQPSVLLDSAQEKLFLKTECEYTFFNRARGTAVEIHWKLIPTCYSIDFNPEHIWRESEYTTLEGKSIRTLSREHLLIALCIHGIGHRWGWNQLKLIHDIAGLLNLHKNFDWEKVWTCASEARVKRILLLGLILAQDMLGAKIPEEISEKRSQDPGMRPLLSLIGFHGTLDSEPQFRMGEEIAFWFWARENPLDKLNCISHLMLEPTAVDWGRITLPTRLYPLYYLIHPARVILDYGIKRRPKW